MTAGALKRNRERVRIAYLTITDPDDRTSWSGTHFSMAQALEKHCGEVVRVGPLQPLSLKVGYATQKAVRLLTGKRYLPAYTASFSRTLGGMVQQRLSSLDCDVIFAPAGSTILGSLETQVPITYLSDATVRLMLDYYDDFTNVVSSHLRQADAMERSSIQKANQLIYPSQWAANSAIQDYDADPAKINVLPFGANLERPPARQDAIEYSDRDRCRLLFVGVNWNRKGGDIAFETLLELERLGVPAELAVVGCEPPDSVRHPNLKVFPFLNKNNPVERAQLDRLYREAAFFILPTRAECFSIALCEANANGIPILSTQTGGLPELVHDRVNGILLPLSARGDQYAAQIVDLYSDADSYRALRASSRNQFDMRLNWDAWGKAMRKIIEVAVARPRLSSSIAVDKFNQIL